jgi:preprotein translocase subunit SecE
MMTTLMVVLMTSLLGIFFFGIDSLFGWIVKMLLGLAAGNR